MSDLVPLEQRIENAIGVIKEMESAFLEIQQPRSAFVLEKFVVGQHDTLQTQYSQCVLELQVKYDNIRRAKLNKKKLMLKMEEHLKKGTEIDLIDADLLKIDIEEQDRAMLGALREFEALYRIWQAFPKKYTREELDANQPEYWEKRLTRQSQQDMQSGGRVGAGNQEAIRQLNTNTVKQISNVKKTEQKYLDVGDTKCLIAVPTRQKAEKLPCIEKLEVPSGMQVRYYNIYGKTVHDAYNDAALTALKDGAEFLLTVEDDTFPPSDGFIRLIKKYRESNNKKLIIGGWYPKKSKAREGTPIIIKNDIRQALEDDGDSHEVYTIPMGFTLIPTIIFNDISFPFFVTTENLTQDSFFSQNAREAGYVLLCDTSIKCKHHDIKTGEIYS